MAPDTRIIYDYLIPRHERDFATPAIEALMKSDSLKTVLLPDVEVELHRVSRNLANVMHESIYKGIQISEQPSEWERPFLFTQLRECLKAHYEHLVEADSAIGRLYAFLASPRWDRNNWDELGENIFECSAQDTQELFDHMRYFYRAKSNLEHRQRDQILLRDAQKISMLLAAQKKGVQVPLIADSASLRRVFDEKTSVMRPDANGLLIGSFTAVTIISLSKANTREILRLRDAALSVLTTLQKAATRAEEVPAEEELQELLGLTFRLADIGSVLTNTWKPPHIHLPLELDLAGIAGAILEKIGDLHRSISKISWWAGGSGNSSPRREAGLAPTQEELNRELLKTIQSGNEGRIFQSLAALQKGYTVNVYNINQSGNNLSANVDSFKTTHMLINGFPDAVATQLKTLLESITLSSLPEVEKAETLQATSRVAEEVKEHGKLAGTTRMLWNGIRESIKIVPSALSAWDALSKHWS